MQSQVDRSLQNGRLDLDDAALHAMHKSSPAVIALSQILPRLEVKADSCPTFMP